MATEQEISDAYEKGLVDGAATERAILRSFTGLRGILAPDARKPEHEAYLSYERELADKVETVEEELAWTRHLLEQGDARVDEALTAHTQALAEHRETHERNLFTRAWGELRKDRLPEKIYLDIMEYQRKELRERIEKLEDILAVMEVELPRVSGWLDQMYATTAAQRQARATDKERAARDVTSRGFLTYQLMDFLEENPERKNPYGPDLPSGLTIGGRWRRDGDDEWHSGSPTGQWRCTWSRQTKETAVWIAGDDNAGEVWLLGAHIESADQAMDLLAPLEKRQAERNSLALVLDAYTDAYIRWGVTR